MKKYTSYLKNMVKQKGFSTAVALGVSLIVLEIVSYHLGVDKKEVTLWVTTLVFWVCVFEGVRTRNSQEKTYQKVCRENKEKLAYIDNKLKDIRKVLDSHD